MLKPELFRKQIYCIEESNYDIFGTFRRTRSDSVPGELCPPCPPRYAPGQHWYQWSRTSGQVSK